MNTELFVEERLPEGRNPYALVFYTEQFSLAVTLHRFNSHFPFKLLKTSDTSWQIDNVYTTFKLEPVMKSLTIESKHADLCNVITDLDDASYQRVLKKLNSLSTP